MPEGTMTGHPLEEIDSGLASPTANPANGSGTPKGTQPDYEDPNNPKPEEDAKAYIQRIEKQNRDKDSMISRQSEQLRELGNQVSELRGQLNGMSQSLNRPSPEDEEAWRDEVLADIPSAFKKMQKQMKDEFDKALKAKEQEFVRKMQIQRAADKSWERFYQENDHLAEYRNDIVPAVYDRLSAQIQHLTDAEAFKLIKEESEKEILKWRRRFGGNQQPPKTGFNPNAGRSSFFPQHQGLPPDSKTLEDIGDEIMSAHEEINNRLKGRNLRK